MRCRRQLPPKRNDPSREGAEACGEHPCAGAAGTVQEKRLDMVKIRVAPRYPGGTLPLTPHERPPLV
jgi:hypothetical protein